MRAIEHRASHRRLCRVWHPAPLAAVLVGMYGSARVDTGPVAYQWDDGEIVED